MFCQRDISISFRPIRPMSSGTDKPASSIALSAIEEAGLSVPDDIGLIGLNDMEMSRWQNIGLTTIRQPVARIIDAAIELVVKTIETPDRDPEIRLFSCRLSDRRTLR